MIPVLKTTLPSYRSLQKYLEQIDLTSVYSNFGPLHCKLTDSISKIYSVENENICLLNSGTSGLIACIFTLSQRLQKKTSELIVALPAWSFVATAQAPLSLGCRLRYIDTDLKGFANPPDELVADILIVVAPFGEPVDINFWLKYQEQTGILILFDCAASFSTLVPSPIPAVVSCHATKGFSTGEGGFVACLDSEIIRSVRMFSNFGFQNSRNASGLGINLKLSEINCAYGLTILDNPSFYFQPYLDQIKLYNSFFEHYSGTIDPFNTSFMRTTYNIQITKSDFSRQKLMFTLIDSNSIETRSWWGNLLPSILTDSFVSESEESHFPLASSLSNNVIGIPMGTHIRPSTQKYIFDSLLSALSLC